MRSQQFRNRVASLDKTLAAQGQVLDASARMAAKGLTEEQAIEFVWERLSEFETRSEFLKYNPWAAEIPASQFINATMTAGAFGRKTLGKEYQEDTNRRLYSGGDDGQFGIVGNIDQINFYDYLSYRSQSRSAGNSVQSVTRSSSDEFAQKSPHLAD